MLLLSMGAGDKEDLLPCATQNLLQRSKRLLPLASVHPSSYHSRPQVCSSYPEPRDSFGATWSLLRPNNPALRIVIPANFAAMCVPCGFLLMGPRTIQSGRVANGSEPLLDARWDGGIPLRANTPRLSRPHEFWGPLLPRVGFIFPFQLSQRDYGYLGYYKQH